MRSLILQTVSKSLFFISLVFSIWVLFRGHNSPGGGFIGGLVAASGCALYMLAQGASELQRLIKIRLSLLMAIGMLFGLSSGLIALLQHKNFLTALWINIKGTHLKIGSPILFDISVYLLVLSSLLLMILSIEESA